MATDMTEAVMENIWRAALIPSEGGVSRPDPATVFKKEEKKRKRCVLRDGLACEEAESQIEADAHPRSV